MKKKLVLVGGGHAHLTCLKNVESYLKVGAIVTLISPSSYQYYSSMGPGLLSGRYSPEQTRFNIKKMIESKGGTFIKDKVVEINPKDQILRLESDSKVNYDIVSFNVGSNVIFNGFIEFNKNIVPIKPIENLYNAKLKILENQGNLKQNICILGGGAAGVEISGNLCNLAKKNNLNINLTLISGDFILSRYPNKVRTNALRSLRLRKINILENSKAQEIKNNKIVLNDNTIIDFDLLFLATGVSPPPIFKNSGLRLAKDNSFIVNYYLQSIDYPNIFGGGDCVSLENYTLEKVGVHAVRENPILFHNIKSILMGNNFREFKPKKKYLLILNMGDGKAIAWKGNYVSYNKLAFTLKEIIDKRFMNKFQI